MYQADAGIKFKRDRQNFDRGEVYDGHNQNTRSSYAIRI